MVILENKYQYHHGFLENIDTDIVIVKGFIENIDINKGFLQNIDSDEIMY